MNGVLKGLRVIEMGHVVAIPSCAALLADWGAEVIKVEPLSGDMLRGVRRFLGVDMIAKYNGIEIHYPFQLLNRNKKSIAINLRAEKGKDILYKLVQQSDVFISNYEHQVLHRFGLDYTTLSRINPRLIYGILTGYGLLGPDKDERGFDYSAAWARSGMQFLIGQPGTPPPPQRPGLMDNVAAVHVAAGVLAALWHREKTGEGQELQFSLYHSAVWTLSLDIQAALVGSPLPKDDRTKAPNPLWNTYRTKDNRWLQLVMLQSDLYWPSFCRAIERPELENDPRFNNMEARERNCEELIQILDEIMASKTMQEWEKRFREHNCIYGRVQAPSEVVNDPQALANNFFATLSLPSGVKLKVVATPVKFCQNPASVREGAPELGQHTEEILLDLGYSWDDIAKLKEEGVIL